MLHHPPDMQATSSLVAFLRGGGTEEQVIANVAASNEYFQLAGGSREGFVARLVSDLLARAATPLEQTQLVAMMSRPGATRSSVAQYLLASEEYGRSAIQAAYQTFLKHPADAAALAAFRVPFQQGGSRAVIVALLASPEYYGLS
jgi:hypothetical protein